MSKKLVAYFSPEGHTAVVAEALSKALGADIYEIKPEVKYTAPDLDWTDKSSRSTIEMNNKNIRPALLKDGFDPSAYDTIYLGFPIWWYVAPTLINTFLESYDFSGKTIKVFATSGGSGFGNTLSELKPSAPNSDIELLKVLTRALSDPVAESKIKNLIELCR